MNDTYGMSILRTTYSNFSNIELYYIPQIYIRMCPDNNFTNITSKYNAEGFFIETSDNVIVNNITSEHNTYGIRMLYSDNINITTGSFWNNTYDYYMGAGANPTNNFTNTNFTGPRTIYFIVSSSWFTYSNETSGSIRLKTNVSERENITRELTNWNQTLIQWNDTSNESITARYNITGLAPDTYYKIYNNSVLAYNLATDSSGNLESFTIDHDATEREIKVQEAGNISSCQVLDIDNMVYYLSDDINEASDLTCINVTAENVTLECQGYTIDGDYSSGSYGIFTGAYNTTIKNCDLNDWDRAVYYNNSDDGLIYNVTAISEVDIDFAVTISRSNNNQLTNITITSIIDQYFYGILISNSNNTELTNISTNVGYGPSIRFGTSINTVVSNSSLISHLTTAPVDFVDPLTGEYCNQQFIDVTSRNNKPIAYYNYSASITDWDNNASYILLCGADNSVIDNVTLDDSPGIRLYDSDNCNLTNIEIYNSNSLYLYRADNTNLTNIISRNNSNGVWTFFAGGSTFYNVTAENNGAGLHIRYTTNLNVTGGSVWNNSNDYYFWGSGSSNFTDTNFTGPRRIFFNSNGRWFSYNNETNGNIWLKTNVSEYENITRELIVWSQRLMQWNDTSNESITMRYNLTGLINDTNYDIYNNSILVQTLQTDSNGVLPSFTIEHDATEREIRVQETDAPTYSDDDTNNTDAGLVTEFTLKWTENDDLSGYIFAIDNCTGVLVNDSWVAFSGQTNWSNVTKTINETEGCTIEWKVYANDSSNNWNASENFSFFTSDNVFPTWSNNQTNLVSLYTSTGYSNFSIDWNDNSGTVDAYLEHNFTGAFQNASMADYYPTFNYSSGSLAAGTYQFRFVANDSSGNGNATGVAYFTIEKASPVLIMDNDTASVNTSGLVGYWKFDEGVGNDTYDKSGNGNNGTLENSTHGVPIWTTGRFGKGLDFDGDGDYVFIESNPSLLVANGTVAAWIYPLSTDGERTIYSALGGPSADRMPYFRMVNGDLSAYITNGTDYQAVNHNSNLQTNAWHHVVFWYNGTNTGFYINGIKVYDVPQTVEAIPPTSDCVIGSFSPSYQRVFNGTIDEVMIFNRTLSADEIRELYRSNVTYPTQTNFSLSESNVGDSDVYYDFHSNGTVEAIWHFDEGYGNYSFDETGVYGNATLNENVSWTTNGKYGGALEFNVTKNASYVSLPNLTLGGQTTVSVEAWVNWTGSNQNTVVFQYGAATTGLFILADDKAGFSIRNRPAYLLINMFIWWELITVL
jgi:hypothetical protein